MAQVAPRLRLARAMALLGLLSVAASNCGGPGATGAGPSTGGTTDNSAAGGAAGRIDGSVVNAANVSQGVGDAYVYVTPKGIGGKGLVRQSQGPSTTSRADGTFRLDNVPSGQQTVAVQPPAGSGYAGVEVTLDLASGQSLNIRITLVQQQDASRVAKIKVSPPSATVAPGNKVAFTAIVLDGNANPLALKPTWSTLGGVGSVDADGVFTAGSQSGTGFVVARIAGEMDLANVTVVGATGGGGGGCAAYPAARARHFLGDPVSGFTPCPLPDASLAR